MEEYHNVFEMAVGVTVNPSLQPYRAEYHEQIMVHYYKSLNYLQLGNIEDALVEVRRLNLKEGALNTSTKGKEKKYSQDPFGLLLMGMIYEASGDNNNAFIAYRNAKQIYETDQTGLYKNNVPVSLEQDLLRTARRTGIYYESAEKYDANYAKNGELILFYETGLSPIKAEQNYFFNLRENNDGFFFESDDLNVPVDYDFNANNENFNPNDLGMIRVAFPYYVMRECMTNGATIKVNGNQKKLQVAQDISALAFQIEKDNFFKNLGKDLLRVTLKKIAELAIAKQNEYMGAALNVANMISEKADTRNWQTLPGQIQFVRIPLQKGANEISISTGTGKAQNFIVEGNGTMVFKNICEF